MTAWLDDPLHSAVHGAKAACLAKARRSSLPVPAGFALDPDEVARLAAGSDAALVHAVAEALVVLGDVPVAVRSSAIGEDSAQASFAGQHTTALGVTGVAGVVNALARVASSAHTPAAHAYRDRLGFTGAPRVAAVIQELVAAEPAGVLLPPTPSPASQGRWWSRPAGASVSQ